jgi:hypothetical protein
LEPNRKLFLEYLPFILHGALVGVGSLWLLLSTKLANIKKLKIWLSFEIMEVKGPKNYKKKLMMEKSCGFF